MQQDDKLQCDNILGPCVHTLRVWPDARHQQATGRFIGAAQADVTSVRLEDTPEGKAAELYIDGQRAPAQGWTPSGGAAPKTWRVLLVGKQPRQNAAPFPHYLLVDRAGQSAPQKLPLVFLWGLQVTTERQYLFLEALGIDANSIERVKRPGRYSVTLRWKGCTKKVSVNIAAAKKTQLKLLKAEHCK